MCTRVELPSQTAHVIDLHAAYAFKDVNRLLVIRLMEQAIIENPDEGEFDPLERVGNPLQALALIERFIGTWQAALSQTRTSYSTWEGMPEVILRLQELTAQMCSPEGHLCSPEPKNLQSRPSAGVLTEAL